MLSSQSLQYIRLSSENEHRRVPSVFVGPAVIPGQSPEIGIRQFRHSLPWRGADELDAVLPAPFLPYRAVPLDGPGSHRPAPELRQVPFAWYPLPLPCVLENDEADAPRLLEFPKIAHRVNDAGTPHVQELAAGGVPNRQSRPYTWVNTYAYCHIYPPADGLLCFAQFPIFVAAIPVHLLAEIMDSNSRINSRAFVNCLTGL